MIDSHSKKRILQLLWQKKRFPCRNTSSFRFRGRLHKRYLVCSHIVFVRGVLPWVKPFLWAFFCASLYIRFLSSKIGARNQSWEQAEW